MRYIILLSLLTIGLSVEAKYENYSVRPSVTELKVKKKKNKIFFNGIVEGMIRSVVFMANSFDENTHFYFLARDAEYAYDIAEILSDRYPGLKERIHLINISTALSFDTLLPSYLEQVGINNSFFSQGKKAVFVETGFMGTVPEVIKNNFSKDKWDKLGLLLFDSNSSKFPSVSFFADYGDAGELEEYPHYTDTAISYLKKDDGRVVPISIPQSSDEKERSIDIMSGIKVYLSSDEAKKIIEETEEKIKEGKNSQSLVSGNLLDYYGKLSKKKKEAFFKIFEGKTEDVIMKNLKNFVANQNDWARFFVLLAPVLSEELGSKATKYIFKALLDDNIIGYDDYELFEDLILSYLYDFARLKNTKLAMKVFDRAIKFEAEESLEKLLWALSKRGDVESFDSLIAKVIKSKESIFDSDTISLKIVYERFIQSPYELPKTRKSFDKLEKSEKIKFVIKTSRKNKKYSSMVCKKIL